MLTFKHDSNKRAHKEIKPPPRRHLVNATTAQWLVLTGDHEKCVDGDHPKHHHHNHMRTSVLVPCAMSYHLPKFLENPSTNFPVIPPTRQTNSSDYINVTVSSFQRAAFVSLATVHHQLSTQ